MTQIEREERRRNRVHWLLMVGAVLTAVVSTALAVHVSEQVPTARAAHGGEFAEPRVPAGPDVDHSVVRGLQDEHGPDPAPGVSVAAYGS